MNKKILLWICMLFLIVGAVSAVDLGNGLQAWFSFEASTVSGTNVSDETGNYWGTALNSPNLTYTGKVGTYALSTLSASSQALTLNGSNANWLSQQATNDFTYCSWVKPLTSAPTSDDSMCGGSDSTTAVKTGWGDIQDGIRWCNGGGGCSGLCVGNFANWDDGNWHYKCVIHHSNGDWNVTYDGNSVCTGNQAYTNGLIGWSLGRWDYSTGSWDYDTSKHDEVAWWNRTLNSSEITWLYNSGSGRTYYDATNTTTRETQPNSTHYNFTYDSVNYLPSNIWWDDFQRGWDGTSWAQNLTLGDNWTKTAPLNASHIYLSNKSLVIDSFDNETIYADLDYSVDRFDRFDFHLSELDISPCPFSWMLCDYEIHFMNSTNDKFCNIEIGRFYGTIALNGASAGNFIHNSSANFSLRIDYNDQECDLYVDDVLKKSMPYASVPSGTPAVPSAQGKVRFYKYYYTWGTWAVDYVALNMQGNTSRFYAKSLWDNESLNITVSLTNGSSYTGVGLTLPYSRYLEGLGHNITFGDYFLYRPSQAITTNQTWHYQWAELYGANLTFNASLYNGTPLMNFTVNITDSNNLSKELSTTNGSVYWLVDAGVYSARIIPDYYSIETDAVTVVAGVNQNHQFTVYEPNTANIVFKDEETDAVLAGRNTSYVFFSETNSFNGSTTTGYANVSVPTETYRVIYHSEGYDQRSYWLTMRNQTHANLTLYTINATDGTLITITLEDDNTIPLEDWYIKALRQFINDSTWRVVEIDKTDYEGQTLMNLELYYVPYAFLVEGTLSDGTNFTQYFDPSSLKYDSITLRINTAEDVIGSWSRQDTIAYTFNHTQSGTNHTVRLVYTDTDNLLEEMCMRVERSYLKNNQVLYEQCSQSSSGILEYTFTATEGSYKAVAYYDTTTEYSSAVLKTILWDIAEFFQLTGGLGLLMVVIMVATCGVLYAFNPTLAVFGAIGGLVLAIALGLSIGATILYSTLIIVGLIVAFKVKS